MRALLLALAAGLCGVVAQAEEPQPAAPLAGLWKFITLHVDGKDSEPENLYMVVRENRMCIRVGNEEQADQFELVLDPKSSPKTIDVYKIDQGKRDVKLYEGVYTLVENELRMAVNLTPGPPWNRPAAVVAGEGAKDVLVVLRRE